MPAAMRILLTGDYAREEFAPAVAEMREAGDLTAIVSLKSAAEWLTANSSARLTVVAQARPGQFTAAAIERLRAAAPLTPIVALLGSWCEGEMRSGSPWPGVPRVYWHQWSDRFQRESDRIARGELSEWQQPLTATADERLLWNRRLSTVQRAAVGDARKQVTGVVAVVSDEPEMTHWLAATCRQHNLSAIATRRYPSTPIEGVSVLVWDAGLPAPGVAEEFSKLAGFFAGAAVVVLLDFPRADDVLELTSRGAAAILAKPFGVADFVSHVKRLGTVSRERTFE